MPDYRRILVANGRLQNGGQRLGAQRKAIRFEKQLFLRRLERTKHRERRYEPLVLGLFDRGPVAFDVFDVEVSAQRREQPFAAGAVSLLCKSNPFGSI